MVEGRSPSDPMVGRTIGGRYRLLQRLGTGGMSSVYLARHTLIERLMAIKTLRRDLAQDPVQRDRFVREARAVNRINHPNIVEITDFGETDDGLCYLVMEYVPGESLLRALREAPFTAARAFHIVEQCGSALARAHQMGVVHRDLKPENIILVPRKNRREHAKILDFGIAKILDAPSLTGSQQIFGTPGYIAPEYIQSTSIDGRADLYSLGVILYEMVTAALPFDYEYPGDLLVKHVTEPPIPPTRRRPGLEQPIEDLVLRCLQKDPDKRFRDAFHFLEELRRTKELVGGGDSWGGLNEDASRPSDISGELGNIDPATLPPEAGSTPHEIDIPVDASLSITANGETSPEGEAKRPITASYDRQKIPLAPKDDLLDQADEDLAIAIEVDAPTPELGNWFDEGGRDASSGEHGLAGVRKWRARFDAIRALLDEVEPVAPSPLDVEQAMAAAQRTLDALEEGAKSAQMHQQAVESLSARARDVRRTLGQTIDELAAELSRVRGEMQRLVERRQDLEPRRESARVRSRQHREAEGEADALLWELAAIEEELRKKSDLADEHESRLGELRIKLEHDNEELEIELSVQIAVLDQEMGQLLPLAAALRGPLARCEEYVRAIWEMSGRDPVAD